MIGTESRRKRAALLRKKREEENIIDQINNQNNQEIKVKNMSICNGVNKDKIKRIRMQNAKGTSNMFIKP